MLRSRDGVQPLIVSPGHCVGLDTAAELILRFSTGRYRLPEPTRLADRLASRRTAALRRGEVQGLLIPSP